MKTLINKISKLNEDEVTFILFAITVITMVTLAVIFNANSLDQVNAELSSYGK